MFGEVSFSSLFTICDKSVDDSEVKRELLLQIAITGRSAVKEGSKTSIKRTSNPFLQQLLLTLTFSCNDIMI